MNEQGPSLETLTRRLAECPPEFLLPPIGASPAGQVDVAAVACDLLRSLETPLPSDEELSAWRRSTAGHANAQKLVAVAAWLLHDPWFLQRPAIAPRLWPALSTGLNALAEVVRAEDCVQDADRREELVRVCLGQLGLRPEGETVEQASDRSTTLDSVARLRVIAQTRQAEARARELRRKMAEEAARAAAARYSPE